VCEIFDQLLYIKVVVIVTSWLLVVSFLQNPCPKEIGRPNPQMAAATPSSVTVPSVTVPTPAAAAAAAGVQSVEPIDGGAKAADGAKTADPKKDDKKDVKGLDDDKDAKKPLKLSSKDKKEFTVERKQAFISTLVKTSLENDDKAEEVPILGVTGAILDLVVTYMKEHKGVEPPIIEKPLRSKVMKDVCPHKWDADFIDKIGETRQQLYDLILAANYMDIKSLLHLGCAKVASLIKGQPLEKIKEILDPNQGKKTDAKDAKDAKDSKDAKADPKPAAAAAAPAAAGAGAAAPVPMDMKDGSNK
jgi:S-phase kinase-associated protein 1